MSKKRKIVILGATGSIGDNTLKVIDKHINQFEIIGVAAHSNTEKLASIIKKYKVPHACIYQEEAYQHIKNKQFSNCTLYSGLEGLNEIASLPEADLVVIALVGSIGIHPTLAAIKAKKNIAIANKEPLVMAGKFIMDDVKEHGVQILPIDSEHNSIFQCIESIPKAHIEKILLTASGGIFRDLPIDHLKTVTPEQAIQHPNWDMGAKVTVDTSTLVNKGLELIEARWLFGLEPKQLDAVIHRQSIIHSLIQLVDGCILSQLNPPNMTFAIQHCLLHPNRAEGVDKTLDFNEFIKMDLEPVNQNRYPGFKLAKAALFADGLAPAIFNAANEEAVHAFLNHKIRYLDIPRVIESTLNTLSNQSNPSLEAILNADTDARSVAQKSIAEQKPTLSIS